MIEWRPVKGLEGKYEISNTGLVRTVPRVLKTCRIPSGHEQLVVGGRNTYVHRLVAEAFLDNPDNLRVVHHRNHIPHDNRVENLEWVNHSQNNQYAWDNGRTPPRAKKVRSYQDVSRTLPALTYDSAAAAAKANNVCRGSVARACRVKGSYIGLYWEYV